MWDPSSITSGQINDLRAAAEQAWGDDTRSLAYVGHPQPSAGHCFVTSHWLTSKLGGHVGEKNGHYFWVSPDKSHVLDLTGDQFAYQPTDPSVEGVQLDDDDEPWTLDEDQKRWRPGPSLYKRADHPLFKGLRVIDPIDITGESGNLDAAQRATRFSQRADAALSGERVSKTADLMGDAYPGETPQKIEEMNQLTFHDEPDYNPESDLSTHEYRFVYANGQLQVSPVHSHDQLASKVGLMPEDQGPAAMGYATVNGGHVRWQVTSNIGLRDISQVLKNYSHTVGWKWDGVSSSEGGSLDDLGPEKMMYSRVRDDEHLILSEKPLPRGDRIKITGNVARVAKRSPALEEWANDFGLKLAEYPGGTDMTDRMHNREHLDLFNNGDPNWQPERSNPDAEPTGPLTCGKCGEQFPSLAELRLHHRGHEPHEDEIQDGHFPQVQDFDEPLGFGTHPVPNSGGTIATVVQILPTHKLAYRHPRFELYAKLFGYDHDEGTRFYGAYRSGQLVGYGAVRLDDPPELLMIDSLRHGSGIGSAILRAMQDDFGAFYTHADSKAGERLMRRHDMINVKGQLWRYSAGSEPKDMIEEAVPFVYDKHSNGGQGSIHIGYPGQLTRDIQGHFTPGGIVEGYYEPGGKVVLIGNLHPGTLYHFGNLWYAQHPQMQITSVEQESLNGETQKLASTDIGPYLQAMVAADQAASGAYRALRQAGGEVYVVGGAVRDATQGREPKDLDLMVRGLPEESIMHALKQLPGKAIQETGQLGKKFGMFRYVVNGQEVEIAMPRTDLYERARRGEGVITTDPNMPVEKDLERRDFTANSMAVNLDTGERIDPFGGAQDIERGILRTTHPNSFEEDPTRIVRALTAHSRFGLNPDERTRHEMEANGHLLRHESPDTLNKVLTKLFASGNPASAIRLGQETGALKHIFPELADNWDFHQRNPHHKFRLGEHSLQALDNVAQLTTDPDVRLSALLHDVGKPDSQWIDENGIAHYYEGPEGQGANHEIVGARITEQRLRALNYPVARINRMCDIVRHHMFPAFSTARGARRFLQRVGPHADDLLNLRQADQTGKGQTAEEVAARTSADQMRELVDQARKQQAPTDLSNLAINGNDLINMGMTPGPQIGQTLRNLLNDVVQEPTLNERETLLNRAQTYMNAQS